MRHEEADIQKAIVDYVRIAHRGVVIFAVPNGGSRNVREAVNLKRQGVLAGVPDLCVMWGAGLESGIGFLEVKTARGKLSAHQQEFAATCQRMGHPWALVRSVEEARDALNVWGAR